jgi:hypothetical protein
MSLSPSLPQGAPTLAEVLIHRTFDKPTQPFVDGEFLKTLTHADENKPAIGELAASGGAGDASTQSGDSDAHATPRSSAGGEPGRSVDVRV